MNLTATRSLVSELPSQVGEDVLLRGWVHNRRDLGGVKFLILRDRSGLVQCVFSKGDMPLQESCVEITGKVVENARAPGGFELHADSLTSSPKLQTRRPSKSLKRNGRSTLIRSWNTATSR